jgi:hypothetical protein
MEEIIFLEGSRPLRKRFYLVDGEIKSDAYPMVARFTSHTHEVNSLADIYTHLMAHAALGHCMLKGTIKRDLQNESRKGSTSADALTAHIVFDLDGSMSLDDAEAFIKTLPKPFQSASYVLQYSASMGIKPGLRAHIHMRLKTPVLPALLKLFLIQHNLDTPELRQDVSLTRSKNAMRYPLDITVCQNDKLIYIAPPELSKDVELPFEEERIKLIEKKNDCVNFNFKTAVRDESTLKKDQLELLNELLKTEGLPTRRNDNTRIVRETEVGRVTNKATVTGVKENGKFTYLNLNEGDSWGYWHLTGDPYFLHNFKGEPVYVTREVCPEYFAEAVERSKEYNEEQEQQNREQKQAEAEKAGYDAYVFIDSRTSRMYRAKHQIGKPYIDITLTPNLFVLRNFQKIHGLDPREEVEEWDMYFDPAERDYHFSADAKRVNLYRPTKLMLEARAATKPPRRMPEPWQWLFYHVVANDREAMDYFINWIAYIVQYAKKTGICVVLQGTFGTGKGVIYEILLQELIGHEYTPRVDLETMSKDQFNGYLKEAILCLHDEADTAALSSKHRSNKLLKELITEKTQTIREMQVAAYKTLSSHNHLMFSNVKHIAQIDPNDRRFSVMPRQEEPLNPTSEQIEALKDTLSEMAAFLMHYEVSEQLATRPLLNEARALVQELSLDSSQEAFQRIRIGDMQWLLSNEPDFEDSGLLQEKTQRGGLPTYRQALLEIYENRKTCNISSNALETLIYYLTGNAQPTKNKFSKWAAHQGFIKKLIKVNGVATRGYKLDKVQVNISREELKMLKNSQHMRERLEVVK